MVWAPESHFGRHVPMSLLTGFLGSGKTSLLNWMLRAPSLRDTAIAVNEFGAIPLDHEFLEAATDEIVVLPNGCMCCFAAEDLEASLTNLFTRRLEQGLPEFRRLIIETSGLADPELVLRQVVDNPVTSRFLWLDRVVTTIDAVYGRQQLVQHAEARKQARLADILVITKSDLAEPSELRFLQEELTRLNPGASQQLRQDPALGISDVLSDAFLADDADRSLLGDWIRADRRLAAPSPERVAGAAGIMAAELPGHEHDPGHGHHHRATASATVLSASGPLPWREFQLWLGRQQRHFGERLLRVKGIVEVEGDPQPVVVHAVQSTLHVPVSLSAWPGDERRTRIVFILTDEAGDELCASWTEFLDTLRPATPVQARA